MPSFRSSRECAATCSALSRWTPWRSASSPTSQHPQQEDCSSMTTESTPRTNAYTRKRPAAVAPFRLSAYVQDQGQQPPQRNAELFYLQKQIQSQTPMV